MIKRIIVCAACLFALVMVFQSCEQEKEETVFSPESIGTVYKAAPSGVQTRWFSSENKDGLKGQAGKTNKGAKGDAFSMIGPKDTLRILDYEGTGIITKIWSACSFGWTKENHRKISVLMTWDNADKPAVAVPFTDFFGVGLGPYPGSRE